MLVSLQQTSPNQIIIVKVVLVVHVLLVHFYTVNSIAKKHHPPCLRTSYPPSRTRSSFRFGLQNRKWSSHSPCRLCPQSSVRSLETVHHLSTTTVLGCPGEDRKEVRSRRWCRTASNTVCFSFPFVSPTCGSAAGKDPLPASQTPPHHRHLRRQERSCPNSGSF